jgi:hypothetical protein
MPETEETAETSPAHVQDSQAIAWLDFLATHPPDKQRTVTDMGRHMTPFGRAFVISAPNITLHCDSAICGGDRKFRCSRGSSQQLPYNEWAQCFLTYICCNCGNSEKVYALLCHWHLKYPPPMGRTGSPFISPPLPAFTEDWQEAIKLGEWPPLGPITPRKLLKLVESDRTLFDLGRRAEGYGMGIGAFAYYRRVVENLRVALFDKLIAAAERLNVDNEIITALKKAACRLSVEAAV